MTRLQYLCEDSQTPCKVQCHSQGVPVALMLIAKLIEFGVVVSAKIGVCAMGKSGGAFFL